VERYQSFSDVHTTGLVFLSHCQATTLLIARMGREIKGQNPQELRYKVNNKNVKF